MGFGVGFARACVFVVGLVLTLGVECCLEIGPRPIYPFAKHFDNFLIKLCIKAQASFLINVPKMTYKPHSTFTHKNNHFMPFKPIHKFLPKMHQNLLRSSRASTHCMLGQCRVFQSPSPSIVSKHVVPEIDIY